MKTRLTRRQRKERIKRENARRAREAREKALGMPEATRAEKEEFAAELHAFTEAIGPALAKGINAFLEALSEGVQANMPVIWPEEVDADAEGGSDDEREAVSTGL